MPLEPGDIFAGYRILRRVGVGGMGTVYLAEHPRLPRRDALKVLAADLTEDPQFRARFHREAALAARLEHPHIVSVYDCGIEGDRLWIAMRYVDGIDAAELIRRSPGGVPVERAVGIVDGAARGLDAAHRRNLLHRDVKPANILVGTRDDGSDDVRVADFGIARTLDEAGAGTSTGAAPATLAYAAPEQFDNRPLDHRVDVYALGCTLAHLLTGAPPFAGRSSAATVHAHLFEPPPQVSRLRPGLPPAMDEVIARAMAKDPNRRYGSCGELAAAAVAALRRPATDPASEMGAAVADRRPPWLIPAVVAAVVLVVAALGTAVWVTRSAAPLVGVVAGGSAAPGTQSTGTPNTGTQSTGSPNTDTNGASLDPATTTGSPTGDSADPASAFSAWGPAAYIAEAFPGLLPAEPSGAGYQGLRCGLDDDEGRSLTCPDDAAGYGVSFWCDPQLDRRVYLRDTTGVTGTREQTWVRATGTGSVWWTTDAISGTGLLRVEFYEADRYFCVLGVAGDHGGQDVYDRWWVGAPI